MPSSVASGTPCIITLKATYFNCIESSSGLLENRSHVSVFIVHSGIPNEAYNRWYSQYKSTCVRDLIIYRIYTKNGAVSKVNKKFISHLTLAQPTPSAGMYECFSILFFNSAGSD